MQRVRYVSNWKLYIGTFKGDMDKGNCRLIELLRTFFKVRLTLTIITTNNFFPANLNVKPIQFLKFFNEKYL